MTADEPVFLNNPELEAFAQPLLQGSRAAGTYDAQTVYNALEAAVNRYVVQQQFGQQEAKAALNHVADLQQALPTQTIRAGDKDARQQFSTPPTLALVAAYALQAQPGESILEPSAGTGSLLAMAESLYAGREREYYANEIDDERRAILDEYFTSRTFGVDARYLNAMLPHDLSFDLILMNPPFSAAQTQRAQNTNEIGFDHVAQALKRLKPGGRLVAILGRGAASDRPTAGKFWQGVRGEYTLRANIGLPGAEYRKYGTSFATQLVIIDNAGPTDPEAVIWTDAVTSPAAAIEGLYERGILERATGEGRPPSVGPGPAGATGERGAAGGAASPGRRGGGGRPEPGGREGVAVPPEPGAPGEAVPEGVAGPAVGERGAGGEPGGGGAAAGALPRTRPGAGGAGNQPDRQLAEPPEWMFRPDTILRERNTGEEFRVTQFFEPGLAYYTAQSLADEREITIGVEGQGPQPADFEIVRPGPLYPDEVKPGALLEHPTVGDVVRVLDVRHDDTLPRSQQDQVQIEYVQVPHPDGIQRGDRTVVPMTRLLDYYLPYRPTEGGLPLEARAPRAVPRPPGTPRREGDGPAPAPTPALAPKKKPTKTKAAAPALGQPATRQDVGTQYVTFQAPYVLEGRPHPAVMVETRSLAAVDPPAIRVTHHLKEETLYPTAALAKDYAKRTGRPEPDPNSLGISQLQLEEVLYAQQRWESTLPDGARAGYFTGAGTGCIAPGTRILNPITGVSTPVEDLAAAGLPHVVLSLTPDGLQPRWAEAPFVKGTEKLYRVTLATGRQVTVTGQHRFLTPSGWLQIDDGLQPGHFLACAEALPECSWESYPSARLSDARHWFGKPEDCLGDCSAYSDPGDARLRPDPDSARALPPSPDDAPARTRPSWQTDAPEISGGHSRHHRSPAPLSRSSSSRAASPGHAGSAAPGLASAAQRLWGSLPANEPSPESLVAAPLILAAGRARWADRWRDYERQSRRPWRGEEPFAGEERPGRDGAWWRTERPGPTCPHPPDTPGPFAPEPRPAAALSVAVSYNHYSRWDWVEEVEEVGEGIYYDLHVPGTENYVAEGIVHHNSGKGRMLAAMGGNGWEMGVRRIYWLSASANLIENARDDLAAIGYGHIPVKKLNDFPGGEPIPDNFEGIIFSTYATLIKAAEQGSLKDQPRRYQIERWLAGGTAADHEGDRGEQALILMDEGHFMKNATDVGRGKPSKSAIQGMKLQQNLKRARVVYASATGMTDIDNMAYLTRLGMWGPGTPWPGGFRDFASEMGDRSKMEMIARDMKARGAYLAREQSYEDPEGRPEQSVEIRAIRHELTGEDERNYNLVADAWQIVLQNMHAALDITGNVQEAKKNAMTAFWGQHQQFFRRFLTALKLPTLYKDIDEQLAEGRSVIISLIGTGAESVKRAVSEAIKNDGDLDDLDLTPIQALVRLVERSFPSRLYVEELGPDGKTTILVAAEDADGNPVHDPDALALKERLLERLSAITERLPGNPLDEILFRYGHGNVAELTSREHRLEPGKDGKLEYKWRGGSPTSVAEMERFNRGEKRIAVISTSASIGISLHAGLQFGNQQRRVQYMLELSWSADKQMQSNGRSHRSNQASAPIFVPVSTNAGGEVRFAASIARRLASMGALTRGSAEATGAGGALDQYDYENPYGRAALSSLYGHIERGGSVPNLANPLQALRDMGVLGTSQAGLVAVPDEEREDIPHFFNRLLALHVDQQNPLFDAFDTLFQRRVENAKASGEFDFGVQDIRGENIREAAPPRVVYTDPTTGAEATYHHVVADVPTQPVTLKDLDRLEAADRQGFFRRNSDQKLVYMARSDHPVNPNRVITPTKTWSSSVSSADLAKNFTRLPENEQIGARRLWSEEVAKVPPLVARHFHILSGSLMGVWDRIRAAAQEHIDMRRALLPDGTRIVGVALAANRYRPVLRQLGASVEGVSAADLYTRVLEGGEEIELTSGVSLSRGQVGRQPVVRINGVDDDLRRELSRLGFPQERIGSTYRYIVWVPADPEQGPALLGQLLQRFPPVETGTAVPAPVQPAVPAPRRRGLAVLPPTQIPLFGVPEGGIPFPTLRWLEQASAGLSVQFQRLAADGLEPEAAERAHDFGVLLWPELVTPEGPAFLGGLSAPVYGPDGEAVGRAVYVNPFPPLYGAGGAYQGLKESPDPAYVAGQIVDSMIHELAHQNVEEEGGPLLEAISAIKARLGPERLKEARDGVERLISDGSGRLTAGYLAGRRGYNARARLDRRPPPALGAEGAPDRGRALGQVIGGGGPEQPEAPRRHGRQPQGDSPEVARRKQEIRELEAQLEQARAYMQSVGGRGAEAYEAAMRRRNLISGELSVAQGKLRRAARLAVPPTSVKEQFLKEAAGLSPSDSVARTPTLSRNLARTAGAITGHPLDLVGFRHESPGGRIAGTGTFYGISPMVSQDYYEEERPSRRQAPLGRVIGPLASLSVESLRFDNPLVVNGGKQGLLAVLNGLPFTAREKQAIRAADASWHVPHSTLDKAIAQAAVRAGFDAILYRKTDRRYQGRFVVGSLLGPKDEYEERLWDSVIVDLRPAAMRPAPKILYQIVPSGPPPEPTGPREGPGHRTEPAKLPDEGLEAQVVEAALPKPPPYEVFRQAAASFPGLFLRVWPFLPANDPAYAELSYRFTHLDKAWGQANMNAVLNLVRVYGELNKNDQTLYRRVLISLDMEEEVGEQLRRLLERFGDDTPLEKLVPLIALPQGDGTPEQRWTPARAARMADWARAELAKPENQAVAEALDIRKLVFNAVLDRLSAAQQAVSGRPLVLNRREWFHHMINDFAESERHKRLGYAGRVQPRTLPFTLRREGSLLNYNTEDIAVELGWLPGALYQTYTLEFLAWVENRFNAKKELQKAALAINMDRLFDILEAAAEAINAKRTRGEPVTADDLYRRRYNAPIAEGFWRLGWICRNHPDWLPGHDDERWEALIDQMAINFDLREDAAAIQSAEPQIDVEARGRFFEWLTWLLTPPQAGQAGSGAAAQIFKGIRARAQRIKHTLGLQHVTWRDLLHQKIGDVDFTGYRAWQPKEGNAFFGAWAVRDRVAQAVLEAENSGTGLALNLTPEDLRRVKVLGGRKPEWVLPHAVADQLDNFKNPYQVYHPILAAGAKLSSGWKQWTLISPFHYVGYNVRNEITDAEMIAYNPHVKAYIKPAARMLTDFMWRKQLPAADLQEWLDWGGQTSTLQASEAGATSGHLDMLAHLNESQPNLLQRIMNAMRVSTDWREAILRVAMYMSYRDQMLLDPDGKPPNYGASDRRAIDAIQNLRLRAWAISNDLMGPYDRVPQGYKLVRTVIPAPFLNWKIINTRRQLNLINNEIFEKFADWLVMRMPLEAPGGGALPPGKPPLPPTGGGGEGDAEDEERRRNLQNLLGLRAEAKRRGLNWRWVVSKLPWASGMLIYWMFRYLVKANLINALAAGWNWALFRDEEEHLPPWVRYRPHWDLGHLGGLAGKSFAYIDRTSGVGDAASFFGVDNIPQYRQQIRAGRMSGWEAFRNLLVQGPAQELYNQVGLPRSVMEFLTRRKLFPSLDQPREITDRWQYVFDQLSLGKVYQTLRPNIPHHLGKLAVVGQMAGLSFFHPGETAYGEARETADNWAKDHGFGDQAVSSGPETDRQSMAYWAKRAAKVGDTAALHHFLVMYWQLGGTDDTFNDSVKHTYPLFNWPKKQRKEFLQSLDQGEQQRWRDMLWFLQQAYVPNMKTSPADMQRYGHAPIDQFDHWLWHRIESGLNSQRRFKGFERTEPAAAKAKQERKVMIGR
jgi:hypothetical protein